MARSAPAANAVITPKTIMRVPALTDFREAGRGRGEAAADEDFPELDALEDVADLFHVLLSVN